MGARYRLGNVLSDPSDQDPNLDRWTDLAKIADLLDHFDPIL